MVSYLGRPPILFQTVVMGLSRRTLSGEPKSVALTW